MSGSAEVPTAEPAGKRSGVAAAVASSIDKIPNVIRSNSLMHCTLYPGGRIEGIVLSPRIVTAHILIDPAGYGEDLRDIGDSVVQAAEKSLRSIGDTRAVAVRIDDLLPSPTPDAAG
jgi:hypothetical protein